MAQREVGDRCTQKDTASLSGDDLRHSRQTSAPRWQDLASKGEGVLRKEAGRVPVALGAAFHTAACGPRHKVGAGHKAAACLRPVAADLIPRDLPSQQGPAAP